MLTRPFRARHCALCYKYRHEQTAMDTNLDLVQIVGTLRAWVTHSLTGGDWARCFLKAPLLFTRTSSHHHETLSASMQNASQVTRVTPATTKPSKARARAATHLPGCSEVDANAGGARPRRRKVLHS